MRAWQISWLDTIKTSLLSSYDRKTHEGFGNYLGAKPESIGEYVSALAANPLATRDTTRRLANFPASNSAERRELHDEQAACAKEHIVTCKLVAARTTKSSRIHARTVQ